jgi:hypothetical protein
VKTPFFWTWKQGGDVLAAFCKPFRFRENQRLSVLTVHLAADAAVKFDVCFDSSKEKKVEDVGKVKDCPEKQQISLQISALWVEL